MANEQQITEAYFAFDPTNSGSLTWDGFKDAARSLGVPLTDKEFEAVRAQAGNKVDLAMFKALYLQLAASHTASDIDADLKAAFAAMDPESSGKITKKMLIHYFVNVGEKLNDTEIEQMTKDCPDSIDFAAFKKLILGN